MMKCIRPFVVASVALAGLVGAAPRGAEAAATPNGGEGIVNFLDTLTSYEGTPDATEERKAAIAKARKHFEDKSNSYVEDIGDLRKALLNLRPVAGEGQLKTILDAQSQIVFLNIGIMNQRLITKDVFGTGKRAIALGKALGTTNEQKRYKKFAKVCAAVESAARKKGVKIYQAP